MEISLYKYRFPFSKPFTTARDTFSHREGFIIELKDQGVQAVGEAAPLPGFSKESMDEVQNYLKNNWDTVTGLIADYTTKNSYQAIAPGETPTSVAFALDTLIVDCWSSREHIPLRRLLFNESRSKIKINATLPINKLEKSLEKAELLWKKGYRTLKVKVGGSPEQEYTLIKQLRTRFPKLKIRIDANQSWDFGEAVNTLQKFTPLNIEYCEEPLTNPSPDAFVKLREQTDIPIALDESLHQNKGILEWKKRKIADIVIIKPMVFGGMKKNFETIRLAVNHDYIIIFTTSLESGIGRLMTATLAAGLSSPQFAHGLNTGSHLAMDVWDDSMYIKEGQWTLPSTEGLGLAYEPEKLVSVKKLDL
ncbi:o-succinylbenzoate synthase [Aliifodinibius sp. S!AR15-10]|uniref:o-succinylbenzoate synthase n=1 Tax=Aliifodinibius sp. S!AR15-10 TaxID=2950437 RepID=UPI00285B1446|nr:o-succinylbenzoate synthase [Aliifodinibius sp. S!AR15-10]MDR8391108.1 o-succinylbenzoate synthase [Aliifodinibius sp. S!AR15-10]